MNDVVAATRTLLGFFVDFGAALGAREKLDRVVIPEPLVGKNVFIVSRNKILLYYCAKSYENQIFWNLR